MKQVTLIGDSIRMGYEATVRERLSGLAEVRAPEENCKTSRLVLARLDEWAVARPADLIHVNCGLHDINRAFGQEARAVPLEDYAANVRAILTRLKGETGARVVWALTTPVNQEWHHRNKPFDRFEADVVEYNKAAREAANELGAVVNDLFTAVMSAGRDSLLCPDGVHFTPEGYAFLGGRVADCIAGILSTL